MLLALIIPAGCGGPPEGADAAVNTFGQRGRGRGRFTDPRALDVFGDEIFVMDKTARIQVFTLDGELKRFWRMPELTSGKPTGMGFHPDGRLFVADTHYDRIVIFDRNGRELSRFGTRGEGRGQFMFPSDIAFDSKGRIYVSDFGNDRITQFSADGKVIHAWGTSGTGPGQFQRVAALLVDRSDRIWVADAANHRLCIFDTDGKLLKMVGQHGSGRGELKYPYDLSLDADGRHVVVVEFGNHRIQRFTMDGRSVGTWGRVGRGKGELMSPWACRVVTRNGEANVYIADFGNNRVVQVRFPQP